MPIYTYEPKHLPKILDPRPHIRFKGEPNYYYAKGIRYKIRGVPLYKKKKKKKKRKLKSKALRRWRYMQVPRRYPSYFFAFRQIMKTPLARDPRVSIEWTKGKTAKIKYTAPLIGAVDTTLIWHNRPVARIRGDAPKLRAEPRAPAAMCMNILFLLIQQAIRNDTLVLEFNSMQKFVFKVLNRAQDGPLSDDWQALDAIRMWQQLGVAWPDLTLEPPFDKVESTRRTISSGKFGQGEYYSFKITLNKQWVDLCKSKVSRPALVLPLPWHASIQNMVMYTLYKGSGRYHINDFVYRTTGNKRATRDTPYCPLETLLCVGEWYKKNLGRFEYEREAYTVSKKTNLQWWAASRHINVEVKRPHLVAAWRKKHVPQAKEEINQGSGLPRKESKGQKAQRA